MTPPARFAAAIEIIDQVLAGRPAEKALLTWFRAHRFAGSKDRVAIRDIVFSLERRRASCAAMGRADPDHVTGRAILRGYLAQEGLAEDTVFGAGGYGPAKIAPEAPPVRPFSNLDSATRADLQPWIWVRMRAQYGEGASGLAEALRHRAPIWLRVNTARISPEAARLRLREEGFEAALSADCPGAIEITGGGRRPASVGQSPVITEGLAEFQDLGPQRAMAWLPLRPGMRALDYCAGGGGKSLALAAKGARVTAHDADPARMKDLPARAARAGAEIARKSALRDARFDLVLCDVPCSGSGAWRRAMANKWSLTPQELSAFAARQRDIVLKALRHAKPGGLFAYMTCSLFAEENAAQGAWISRAHRLISERQFTPLDGSDGFYVVVFEVEDAALHNPW
ncbi:MAG: RsmB/NOP family class I SAM-dependent RNA methyltransferase [Pseudomonadota bacterium]